jgi:hypothetical protein
MTWAIDDLCSRGALFVRHQDVFKIWRATPCADNQDRTWSLPP